MPLVKIMKTATRIHARVDASRHVALAPGRWFKGLSRHGVVAAERFAAKPQTRTSARQLASLFSGTVIIGLGVSLFIHSQLGVPAYDVLLSAVRDRVGISHGQAGWLVTGTLFLVATALGQRPKISGLFYLLFAGVSVDIWIRLINDPDSLAVRVLFVVFGTAAIAMGVALVIHAGLTGGSIELLMRAGETRGFDPFRVRQLLELAIVALGVILGGDLGFATVFFVVAMSPMLKAGRQALEDHRRGRAARLEPVWD